MSQALTQALASSPSVVARDKHNVRLIGVHSMDDPTVIGEMIAGQYESAARMGLDRVGARYAHSIPFSVALYDDLWRANERRLSDTRVPAMLDRFGPFIQLHPLPTAGDPSHAALEVRIALEMLGSPLSAFSIYANSNTASPQAQVSTTQSAASLALWQRAANIATYLTNPALREMALDRLAYQIEAGDECVVLLAYGLGSLVAYDLLLQRPDLPVRCLVTLGSPLGLPGVRAAFAAATGYRQIAGSLPFPNRLPRWVNFYNTADTVSYKHLLSPLCKPVSSRDSLCIEDIDTGKLGFPFVADLFSGHHPAAYLASKTAGRVLRSIVED